MVIGTAGLPPRARLRRAADFAALDRTAAALGGRHFVIRYRPSPVGEPRLGLAVSRRVDKRAVGRNRIKRALRTVFREQRCALPPCDVLVLARGSAAAAASAELRADFQRLLQRLPALPPLPAPGTMPG